jgi:glycosyltransferase involved in cell wall biosynthesis
MIFPLSWIGYALEPLYLRIMSKKYQLALTESESTRKDLSRHGFSKDNVALFRVGMQLPPLTELPVVNNYDMVLFLGAMRPMKRTLDAVKAFEVARDQDEHLRMVLAGDDKGPYAEKVLDYIKQSRHAEAIDVRGRVSDDVRRELLRQATVIVVTSIKEGWGLIVTEANSQGTPAIAYDADGLRDSIRHGKTGMLVKSGDHTAMGNAVASLIRDPETYALLRDNAWRWSREFTFENSYSDFTQALDIKNSTS